MLLLSGVDAHGKELRLKISPAKDGTEIDVNAPAVDLSNIAKSSFHQLMQSGGQLTKGFVVDKLTSALVNQGVKLAFKTSAAQLAATAAASAVLSVIGVLKGAFDLAIAIQ